MVETVLFIVLQNSALLVWATLWPRKELNTMFTVIQLCPWLVHAWPKESFHLVNTYFKILFFCKIIWDKITDFTDALYPKANEASLLLGKVLQDLWEKDEARKNAGSSAPLSPIVCHSRNCPINRMIAFFSLNGRSKLWVGSLRP